MSIKKKLALIIDDDPDFCHLAEVILKAKGMDVNSCHTIAEAKVFLEVEIPNVILLDMELRNEHGTDFLKERGTNHLWQKIPVIVCSSQNLAATVKSAIRFGANDYLLKPIKQTWLIQRVRKILYREINLPHHFEIEEHVDMVVEAQPVSVADSNFVGRSNVGFSKGTIVVASIPQNEGEPIVTHLKCDENSRYSSSGPFDTVFSLASVTEAEKKRVQLLKSFWKF